jgi:hypothetical protein
MEKKLILFLSANPKDPNYPELELIKESNALEDKIRTAEHAKEIAFSQRHEISIGNIQQYIADNKPQIVHFSGHGEKEYLILEGIDEQTEEGNAKALANMFRILNNRRSLDEEKKIRCIVLSACYSEQIAKAVARYVDFVVGMSNAVREDTAKIFAEYFYYHLCSGESFGDAFEFARSQIQLLGIPGQDIPKLEKRKDIDPYSAFLFVAKPHRTRTMQDITEKFNDFVAGKTTVVEFWENERQGGLCEILLSFSEDDKIPAVEKGEIRSIMSNIPAKLNAWKLANNINNQTQVSLLDGEIRQMYINALEILKKYIDGSRNNE